MALIDDLLTRGFFPRELPPPFVTATLAQFVVNWARRGALGNVKSRVSRHSVARIGGLRRPIGIPNPLSQLCLSDEIASSWPGLRARLYKPPRPILSASRPVNWKGQPRAIVPRYSLMTLPLLRVTTRVGARYLVRTDIANFYHSIYTHSIPWALHTKRTAKRNRSLSLLGNRLDANARDIQDGQTVGIPIGPDTSLVLAECVLRAVDDGLRSFIPGLRGFRFVDDFELAFSTLSQAEEALRAIEANLAEFELVLNPRKTAIEELPRTLVDPWTRELASIQIGRGRMSESRDVLDYFSRAFELSRKHPEASVLKYALARLRGFAPSSDRAWQVLQGALLNCASADGVSLPVVLDLLARGVGPGGRKARIGALGDTLESLLERHVLLGHGSEVGWALWGAMAFQVKLRPSKPTCDRLSRMDDDVVALLALDARSRGLIPKVDKSTWASKMTTAALMEENWLLAYEANVKKWLPSAQSKDHVLADARFADFKQAGVHFYDQSLVALVPPAAAAPLPGGAIYAFYV